MHVVLSEEGNMLYFILSHWPRCDSSDSGLLWLSGCVFWIGTLLGIHANLMQCNTTVLSLCEAHNVQFLVTLSEMYTFNYMSVTEVIVGHKGGLLYIKRCF